MTSPDADAQQETLAKLENIFSAYSDVTQESPPGKDPGLGEVDIAFIEDEDLEEGWNEEAIHQTVKQVEHYQRQGYELRDMAILTRYAKEGKRIADAFIAYRNSAEADENLRYEVGQLGSTLPDVQPPGAVYRIPHRVDE